MDHMQIICTSLELELRQFITTQFLQAGCPCRPTSVKALKFLEKETEETQRTKIIQHTNGRTAELTPKYTQIVNLKTQKSET